MEPRLNQTASDTIDLLETRLRRIEYVLFGHQEIAVNEDKRPASRRLKDLEHILDQLVAKSRITQDLLRIHAQHPDLFHNLAPTDVPTSLDVASKLSIIIAAASSYPLTASRLTSINDTPLPPAEESAQLIEAQARAAKIDIQQESQSREIAALKQRSAAVIQRWYAIDIVNTGECWAEVEGRMEHAERMVHREALARQRDKDII